MTAIDAPIRTHLAHPPLEADAPQLRPEVGQTSSSRMRAGLTTGALLVGAAAGLAAPAGDAPLTTAVIGAGLLTALAANWSTCGMSVAAVVAAPKQPGRRGASTPARRLGWHAAGSLLTALPTGALIGAVGSLIGSTVGLAWALGVWAVLAALYGLHELGVIRMWTPMRRRQLPRHLRRTMAPRRVSFLFGAIIGPGFLIFIRSSAYYLLVLGLALHGDAVLGAALFGVVALGRCLPSLAAIIHTRAGGTMPGFLSAMCVVDRRVQIVTGGGLLALAAFAAVAFIA